MDFKEMFERADIESIKKFVLNKGKDFQHSTAEDYSERIEEALKKTSEYVDTLPEYVDTDEVWENITALAETYREVYFEAGMKAGAKIGFELCSK